MPLMGRMEELGPKLEAGTYLMTCTGIEETEIPNSQFDPRVYRVRLRTDDVVDPDGLPIDLDAIASRKLTPGSKMTGWLKAFGIGWNPGPIDLEQIIGRQCMALVEVQVKETGEYARVKELMPPPRAMAARREALAPEPPDDLATLPF